MDHTHVFPYTRFTPRIETNTGTEIYFNLGYWTAVGDCAIIDTGFGLVVDAT
jgi:hypothetical protein